MPRCSVSRRRQLGVSLLLALCLVGAVFAADDTVPPGDRHESVDMAFYRARLAANPKDSEARIALAQALADAGRPNDASQMLDELRSLDPGIAAQAETLRLQLGWQLYNAEPEGSVQRGERRKRLEAGLERALRRDLPEMDFAELADLSLQLERPLLAGEFYQRMALRQPVRAAHWLGQAARWRMAGGDARGAADMLVKASTLRSAGDRGERYATAALDAALASGDPEQAYRLASLLLARMPGKPGLRLRAVEIAESVGSQAKAMEWLAPLVQGWDVPDRVLHRQRSLALASGELEQAIDAAQRLLSRHPGDRGLRTELARMFEWAGQPREALDEWRRLALDGSSDLHALGRAAELHSQLGETEAAAELIQARLRYVPDDHRSREQLARLLEWGGQPRAALSQWIELLSQRGSPVEEAEIERLAPMLYDRAALALLWQWREQQRGLNADEYLQWSEMLVASGQPQESLRVLEQSTRRHPRDLRAWQTLSAAHERSGDLRAALAIWDRYERRVDSNDTSRRERARLLLALGELFDANTVAVRLGDDEASQRLAGEIAWRNSDIEQASRRYAGLWDAGARDAEVIERHIALTRERQGWQAANQLRAEVWNLPGQGYRLQSALSDAEQAGDWPVVRRLLQVAATRPTLVASEGYWLTAAAAAEADDDTLTARQAYQQAVAINPLSSARLSLLWLLIDANDHLALREQLQLWRDPAERDRSLWGVYAAGLLHLGEAHAALHWYRKLAGQQIDDPMWLLDFADTLAAAGYRDSAFRVSHFALQRLGSAGLHRVMRADGDLDLRLVATLETHMSPLVANAVIDDYAVRLAQRPLGRGSLAVAEWTLRREQLSRTRRWLAARHRQRLENPAWLEMAVALADDDAESMEALLRRRESELPSLQRALAERRLGRPGAALSLALQSLGEGGGSDAVAFAAALRAERPRDLLLRGLWQSLGDLDVVGYGATLRSSDDDDIWSLDYDEREFSGIAGLAANERAIRAEWRHFTRSGSSEIRIGERRLRGESQFEWRISRLWSPSEHWDWTFSAAAGQPSEDSEQLRVFGVQSALSAALSARLGSRQQLDLSLSRERLDALGGGRLAEGWRLSGSLVREFGVTHRSLQLGVAGAWLRNALAERVPDGLAAKLPGVALDEIVPRRYASLGVLARLSRGLPGEGYPQTGGMRYFADVWLGHRVDGSNPLDGDFAGTLSVGIAHRLFGGDELGASVLVDEASSATSHALRLWYRLPFGP